MLHETKAVQQQGKTIPRLRNVLSFMTQAVLARSSDLCREVGGTERGPYTAALATPDRQSRRPVTHFIKPETHSWWNKASHRLESKDHQFFPPGPAGSVQPGSKGYLEGWRGRGPGQKPALRKKQA